MTVNQKAIEDPEKLGFLKNNSDSFKELWLYYPEKIDEHIARMAIWLWESLFRNDSTSIKLVKDSGQRGRGAGFPTGLNGRSQPVTRVMKNTWSAMPMKVTPERSWTDRFLRVIPTQ